MEVKSFAAVDAQPEGTFTACIRTFDEPDKQGDIVRATAFSASIAAWRASGSKVPVIYSHQHGDPQAFIGEVDPADLQETNGGLIASGKFYLDEPSGAKVFRQIARKTLKEWSFGYVVQRSKRLAAGARELLQIDLLELGPTLVGMGSTSTLSVKSAADVKAAIAAHRRQLTDEQLDPYRARLDLVRRQLQLEKAARV